MCCAVKKSEIYIMYIISSSSNQNVVYAVKNGEEKKIQQYGNEGVEATYYCL